MRQFSVLAGGLSWLELPPIYLTFVGTIPLKDTYLGFGLCPRFGWV